jgi:hypothetical protein
VVALLKITLKEVVSLFATTFEKRYYFLPPPFNSGGTF